MIGPIINPARDALAVSCQAKTEKHSTSSHLAEPEAVPISQSLENPGCLHISFMLSKCFPRLSIYLNHKSLSQITTIALLLMTLLS